MNSEIAGAVSFKPETREFCQRPANQHPVFDLKVPYIKMSSEITKSTARVWPPPPSNEDVDFHPKPPLDNLPFTKSIEPFLNLPNIIMTNHHEDPVPCQFDKSADNQPKFYTTVPRTWPQVSHNPLYSNSYSNSNSTSTPTSPVNTSSNTHTNHTVPLHKTKHPTPMDRWLAESPQESPFNTISSFLDPPPGHGQVQVQDRTVKGGEKVEQGNGDSGKESERYTEDNWSMERNGQSEMWAGGIDC
ncbi:hypothetical protein BKA65DRAFT_475953 [Rhexocercosporidium sp. MPI-PUGE-AT-0058]|nr:hypothetical protein BKA65DRAFT_475953 [Rhexocercosporidium sp. MPI-PUGE-AT-0058]